LTSNSRLSNTRLCLGSSNNIHNNNADDETNGLESNLEDIIQGDEDIDEDIDIDIDIDINDDHWEDKIFLKKELDHLEFLEKMLEDIEEYCDNEGMCEDDLNDDDTDEMMFMGDVDDVDDDINNMQSLLEFLEESEGGEDNFPDEDLDPIEMNPAAATTTTAANRTSGAFTPQGLEEALLQGVVPVDAGVGSNTLPGDFGFDPLDLAQKDLVKIYQCKFLDAIPGGNPQNDPPPEPRLSALVLRDYREAEIRHGRLAMLAVIIWPIQEKLDTLLLEPVQCNPLVYGPVTLPYLPLFMTLMLMLLGYLDIYTKDIQEEEGIGDAFLPGDCLWDPLKILDGAPGPMKRNMQERELFNGRVAMLAFAAFVFEEATSHEAIINIPGNEWLFVPAYQIPSVQEFLDSQFLTYDR